MHPYTKKPAEEWMGPGRARMPGVLRCPRHLYMYLDAVHVCYANRLSCGLPPTAFDL